jgi:hypothetical protein
MGKGNRRITNYLRKTNEPINPATLFPQDNTDADVARTGNAPDNTSASGAPIMGARTEQKRPRHGPCETTGADGPGGEERTEQTRNTALDQRAREREPGANSAETTEDNPGAEEAPERETAANEASRRTRARRDHGGLENKLWGNEANRGHRYGDHQDEGESPPLYLANAAWLPSELGREAVLSRGLYSAGMRANEIITQYSGIGKHIRKEEATYPQCAYYRSLMQAGVGEVYVIDGFKEPRKGFGMAQFSNHSSDKALRNAKWVVVSSPGGRGLQSKMGIYLRATRNIKPGEEILVDYGKDYFTRANTHEGTHTHAHTNTNTHTDMDAATGTSENTDTDRTTITNKNTRKTTDTSTNTDTNTSTNPSATPGGIKDNIKVILMPFSS